MITKLDWDTDFFGYPVGKIDLTDSSEFNLKVFLNEIDIYKLVYIFSNSQISVNKALHVDSKVIFSKSLYNTDIQELRYCNLYESGKHNYEQLEFLAVESGKYSRFKIDPNFVNNEFERLYRKWISVSVRKLNAIETLLYTEQNQIIGLVTIGKKNEKLAEIGLVAVNPNHQGKGIGSKLIADAEAFALNSGFDTIQVATQQANENAMKLYKRNGYNIEKIIHVYHYWNK